MYLKLLGIVVIGIMIVCMPAFADALSNPPLPVNIAAKMPKSEIDIQAIMAQAAIAALATENEMRQQILFDDRHKFFQDSKVAHLSFDNWVGLVSAVGLNNADHAYISIDIGQGVKVNMGPSIEPEAGPLAHAKPLIDPGTALYRALAGLKKGDAVRFSGANLLVDETASDGAGGRLISLTFPDIVATLADIGPLK